VITDDYIEDIIISNSNVNRALNGDMVKVFVFPGKKGKRSEGEVVEVIKRANTRFSGVLKISGKNVFVIPSHSSMNVDIIIPLSNINNAENGEKVIVEITEWPEGAKNPIGKIIYILGLPGENDVEMQSILSDFGFPLSFSKKQWKRQKELTL